MRTSTMQRGNPPQAPARPGPVRQYDPPTLAEVEAALAFISPDDRPTWQLLAYAIRHEFGDGPEAFATWDGWSQASDRYNVRDSRDVWKSSRPDGRLTIASLFKLARQNGYRPSNTPQPVMTREPRVRPAVVDDRKPWDERLQRAWDDCNLLPGTIGETYLHARGCAVPPQDGDARFHPSVWHPFDRRDRPAIVCRVTDATTGEPMTLHRTFLRDDGSGKADTDKPKLLQGGYRKAGGCIRLWPDSDVDVRLCVAEGVETALTAALARPPAWACVDASNLAAFPVLAGVEALLIVADNDAKGIAAAKQCGRRWHEAGRESFIYTPSTAGADLNDEARHG